MKYQKLTQTLKDVISQIKADSLPPINEVIIDTGYQAFFYSSLDDVDEIFLHMECYSIDKKYYDRDAEHDECLSLTFFVEEVER